MNKDQMTLFDPDQYDQHAMTKHVLEYVMKERIRQDRKWGHPEYTETEWLAILTEEIGEVARAVLNRRLGFNGDAPVHLTEELIQVAAVAVAWVESQFTS